MEVGVEAEFVLEEPSLRYHRLENDCPGILANAQVTAMAAHYKFIVVGCSDGTIHILDHLGNRIQNGAYKKHFSSVNDIAVCDDGNFIASCGNDGFVFIFNLSEPTQSELINLRRIVKTVAISSDYGKSHRVVTGGKKVTLHLKGALGRRINEDLYVPPDGVRLVRWRGNILLFADDSAVRVFDIQRKVIINYVSRESPSGQALEGRHCCHLTWHSDNCFVIGWGRTVQVCHVFRLRTDRFDVRWTASGDDRSSLGSSSPAPSLRSSVYSSNFGGPVSVFSSLSSSSPTSSLIGGKTGASSSKLKVQIVNQFQLDDDALVICGVAAQVDRVILLVYPTRSIESLLTVVRPLEPGSDPTLPPIQPQIVVADVGESLDVNVSRTADDTMSALSIDDAFEEVAREDLEIKVAPGHEYNGLGLVSIPGEATHFIFSRLDMIYAQALSADDRIDWYLEQDLPQRALQIANERPNDLQRHSPKALGKAYLDKLIEDRDFVGAGALCRTIVTDADGWEEQIQRFLKIGQIDAS